MKRIGIYFFAVVAIGCITGSFLFWKKEGTGKIRVEKACEDTDATENISTQFIEDVFQMKNENDKKAFYLKNEDGYLVIYDGKTGEKFDETSIMIKQLPIDMINDINEGIYFQNEKELYEFLENYSS